MREAIIMLMVITFLTASFIFRGTHHKKQANVIRILKAVFISNCLSFLLSAMLFYNTEVTQVMRVSAIKQIWVATVFAFAVLLGTMFYQFLKRPPELETPNFLLGYLPIILHCFSVTFYVSRLMMAYTQGL